MARRSKSRGDSRLDVTAARPAERLLLDAAAEIPATQILCLLSPEGYAPEAFAGQRPESAVCCHVLDLGMAESLRSSYGLIHPNLEIACASDVPARAFDLVTLPFPTWGETELARELLEQGADVLQPGGALVAATDPSGDVRLHEEMRKLFPKVTRLPEDDGVVMVGRKGGPLKKRRDFTYEFAFRDGDRLVRAMSRPGLVSHRRLATSVRPALDVLDVRAGEKVLNLGCDVGAIALAAAAREPSATVVAVDFHPRAIECTQRGAAMNGLTNVEAHLCPGRWTEGRGTFDLVIACPPYIPRERLRDIYVDGIVSALKPGGRVRILSKHSAWFGEEFGRVLNGVTLSPVRDHTQITGTKRPL